MSPRLRRRGPALLAILRAYRPEFQPMVKEPSVRKHEMIPASAMPAVTQVENLTDEELETATRLLRTIGVNAGYLLPAAPPIDVEGTVEDAKKSGVAELPPR